MGDPLDHGFPFVLHDVWRPSTFPTKLDTEHDLFPTFDLDLPSLNVQKESVLGSQPDFFDLNLPELDSISGAVFGVVEGARQEPSPLLVESTVPLTEGSSISDIWDLDDDLRQLETRPKLQTWETFDSKSQPEPSDVAYLSEAGQGAFDALLARRRRGTHRGVLPQNAILDSLFHLSVGRSSRLFQWDAKQSRFHHTLPDVPISGLSVSCSKDLVEQVTRCGCLFKQLQLYSSPEGKRREFASIVALQRAVATVIQTLDEYVTRNRSLVRSLLQFQSMLRQPLQVLESVQRLLDGLGTVSSNEDVIARILEATATAKDIAAPYAEIYDAFGQVVSAPWLEKLAQSMGLGSGEEIPLPQGAPSEQTSQHTHGQERDRHVDALSAFMDMQSRQLIDETTSAINMLRQCMPDHPLVDRRRISPREDSDIVTIEQHDIDAIVARAEQYEKDIMEAIATTRERTAIPLTLGHAPTSNALEIVSESVWGDEDQRQAHLEHLGSLIESGPKHQLPNSHSAVQESTLSVLKNSGVGWPRSSVANIVSSPISRIRPFITTQWRLANGVLLRHLFRDCQLRQQIDLQRRFHLFGNGDFVTRLSTALFSQEAQSAERKRSNIPTSSTMGLRLGTTTGQRWPPASSELRLTLTDILRDIEGADKLGTPSKNAREQPSGLSFAIRELPEAEIERVVDPGSIYALDFLRLQYTVAPPLDAILTDVVMQRYDDIFRFLLRLSRMLHVTTTLRASVLGRQQTRDRPEAASFAHDAHQLVSGLASHVMDLGIDAVWKRHMASLDSIEAGLADEDAAGAIGRRVTVGIDGLRVSHENCVDDIRDRLFLRKRHDGLRGAIEDAFTAVLKGASGVERNGSLSAREREVFDEAVEALILSIASLAKRPSRPTSGTTRARTEESESDLANLLLQSLNWNRCYDGVVTRDALMP